MIAIPQHGLVFLAMTKCASTAIEDALYPYGQIITRKNPRLKHMNYRGFRRSIAPLLKRNGFPRPSYEVVCIFREPVSWLHSWYRYRAREELARAAGRRQRRNYTGNVTFDEFCDAYIQRSAPYATSFGRQANFVRGPRQPVGVDRVFRYEELPRFVDYLSEQLSRPVALEQLNVSSHKEGLQLSRTRRRELREFLAPEYEVYENLADGRLIDHSAPKTTEPDDQHSSGADGAAGNGARQPAETDA